MTFPFAGAGIWFRLLTAVTGWGVAGTTRGGNRLQWLPRTYYADPITGQQTLRRGGLHWVQRPATTYYTPQTTLVTPLAQPEQTDEQINLTARRDLPAGALAYAEQRALEIGITIAGGARVILLDEPTAGMSRSETAYIVGLIREVTEGRTLVMVEHDMGVVFDLADRISVLVYGKIIATGTPEEVRADPAVQEAYLGAALEAEH